MRRQADVEKGKMEFQIVDLYHARERYFIIAKLFWANNKERMNRWAEERLKELDNGEVEKVISSIIAEKIFGSIEYVLKFFPTNLSHTQFLTITNKK